MFRPARPRPAHEWLTMHAFRETAYADAQIDAADRAQMSPAKLRVLRCPALAWCPGVGAIPGRAIGNAAHDALVTDEEFPLSDASRLDEEFRRKPAAASRGRELNTQEFCLHSGYGARFARRHGRGVDGLILGVNIGHGALER